jgi:hypothetical protein
VHPGDFIIMVVAFAFFQGGRRACKRAIAPIGEPGDRDIRLPGHQSSGSPRNSRATIAINCVVLADLQGEGIDEIRWINPMQSKSSDINHWSAALESAFMIRSNPEICRRRQSRWPVP